MSFMHQGPKNRTNNLPLCRADALHVMPRAWANLQSHVPSLPESLLLGYLIIKFSLIQTISMGREKEREIEKKEKEKERIDEGVEKKRRRERKGRKEKERENERKREKE